MRSSRGESPTLQEDLRRIGHWPRVLSIGLLIVLLIITYSVGYEWWWGVLIGGSVFILALSLRIRASVSSEELTVRSYLRTYRFEFDDVLAFVKLPYQGWWSGYTPALLGPIEIAQFDVTMIGRGDRSLPATMGGPKRIKRIADGLNDLVPDGPWPPSDVPQ